MIRPYKSKDKQIILDMIGWPEIVDGRVEAVYFHVDETYVWEDDGTVKGFYTIRNQHGYPSIIHFFIRKEHRNPDTARMLIKDFKNRIRQRGYNRAFLHSCKRNLDKLIQYYFKVKPYAVKHEGGKTTNYYLVEV